VDLDKAIVYIELEQPGAIEAIVSVLGGTVHTCVTDDSALRERGLNSVYHGSWQLTKRTAAGVLHVQSETGLQQQIANILADTANTALGIRKAKKSMEHLFLNHFFLLIRVIITEQSAPFGSATAFYTYGGFTITEVAVDCATLLLAVSKAFRMASSSSRQGAVVVYTNFGGKNALSESVIVSLYILLLLLLLWLLLITSQLMLLLQAQQMKNIAAFTPPSARLQFDFGVTVPHEDIHLFCIKSSSAQNM
jgi:hypothetical protein